MDRKLRLQIHEHPKVTELSAMLVEKRTKYLNKL